MWTFHGGRIDAAQSRYPAAPLPWLDLSTGINPFAWPGEQLAAAGLRRLPSPAALAELEQAAALAFGAPHLPFAAAPGSEIGLRLLGTLPLPRPIRAVAPTYRTHVEFDAGVGRIGVDALETAADAGGTILLCNPNNPDGRIVPPCRLLELTERLQLADGWLVVDEAFADAVAGSSILPFLSGAENVIVFRSFGKFFGLPGLRLGFVSASLRMLETFRAKLGDWPVSGGAIAVGTAAYADRSWSEEMRMRLAQAAASVDRVLARRGLAGTGHCPLYRLVETSRAAALFAQLAAAGILVRPFDYDPAWLRFGLPGDGAQLDRLDRALAGG